MRIYVLCLEQKTADVIGISDWSSDVCSSDLKRDAECILRDNQIVIIDEFTGRMMPGRRWSDGLHQAIEAKENAKIQQENQTLASITFQNYFLLSNKLSGLTGTAAPEAFEFQSLYKSEVCGLPPNPPKITKEKSKL